MHYTKFEYCDLWIPQITSGTAAQHLQYPGTTFYLPLQEFEWLLEPGKQTTNLRTTSSDRGTKHSFFPNFSNSPQTWQRIGVPVLNTNMKCMHIDVICMEIPQHSHLQRWLHCQSCKLVQYACWATPSWTESGYKLYWFHC